MVEWNRGRLIVFIFYFIFFYLFFLSCFNFKGELEGWGMGREGEGDGGVACISRFSLD